MSDIDSDSDSYMNFCEGCGVEFMDSYVDAESGEEDRCQECIRAMRIGASESAMEDWCERKIKRKAKRENISEARARANFSWDFEDWANKSSSDVDVDSDDGAEEAIGEEARGATRKKAFEVFNTALTNGRPAPGPGDPLPTNASPYEETEEEPAGQRARMRRPYPKLQGNTSLVEKKARERKKPATEGGRVLRSGRTYRDLVSSKEDAGYEADAEE